MPRKVANITPDGIKTDLEPKTRLARIADRLLDAINTDPEYVKSDRFVIMMRGPSDDTGGIALEGYDEVPAEQLHHDIHIHMAVLADAMHPPVLSDDQDVIDPSQIPGMYL